MNIRTRTFLIILIFSLYFLSCLSLFNILDLSKFDISYLFASTVSVCFGFASPLLSASVSADLGDAAGNDEAGAGEASRKCIPCLVLRCTFGASGTDSRDAFCVGNGSSLPQF